MRRRELNNEVYYLNIQQKVLQLLDEVLALNGRGLTFDRETPLLGSVPLSEELREHADVGTPLAVDRPDSPAGQAIVGIARRIIAASPAWVAL